MTELSCDDVRDLLSAYFDDELPPSRASAVAQHIAGCAACAAEFDQLRRTSTSMREHLKPAAAPDLLRARVRAALRDTAAPSPATAVKQPRARWPRQLAAAIVIAVASSATTVAVMSHRPAGGTSEQVLSSHVRSLMTNHLTDVASTDQHNVKPWFNGKVDFSPEVYRLDDAEFPLIGGRVDFVGTQPVAVIVYGRRQHVINVFTWPAVSSALSPGDSAAAARGYNALRWTHAGMVFWAVSDLNVAELRQFTDAFRQQAPP